MGKRIFAAAIFLVLAAACSFCNNVSFQILQSNESLSDVCASTYLIEDEILNYFFETGHIVSNVPAAVANTDEDEAKLYNDGYREAVEGGVDQYIQIKLQFAGGDQENQKVFIGTLKEIDWKIVSMRTGKVIENSSSVVNKKISPDEEANVRKFANDFAVHLNKVINK